MTQRIETRISVARKSLFVNRRLHSRIVVGLVLCLIGAGLAMLSLAANPPKGNTGSGDYSSADPVFVKHAVRPNGNKTRTTAGMPLAPTAPGLSIFSSPNTSATQDNFLNGVICTSANECWAVGYYYTNSGTTISHTLIEKWDGTPWSIASSPNTSATQNNFLFSVTCASANECWAVGYYQNGTTNQTLIEKWDGTSWSIPSSPNTGPTQNNFLFSVTCASANECWAVGYYENGTVNQTLIEKWDGASWSIASSPNTSPTQNNVLNGVICASGNECWAVGYYHNGTTNQTLIEKWNGASWSIVSSPNTSPTQNNVLNGVICASANECWTVGYYYTNNGTITSQTLIEKWDGASWSIASSPNTSATQNDYLFSVTCASANDCSAVGYYQNDSTEFQTLFEKWDGTSWSIIGSPNTSATQYNFLQGVTCAFTNECWAVGYYHSANAYQTLIEGSPNTITLQIVTITRLANNHMLLQCLGVANSLNSVQASPDLITPFTTLATRTADANGVFQYEDTDAGSFTKRFYRLTFP